MFTDHYMVAAKFKKILAVGKKSAPSFDGEIFNLKKLHELEFRKQNQIEITNKFAALDILRDDEDINRTLDNIKRISKPRLNRV